MKKGILFDLDGTLWDSAGAVARSWNTALAALDEFQVRITRCDMMRFMGNLLFDIGRMMLPKHLSNERVQQIVDLCIEYEHAYLRKYGAPLYENLIQTLGELKKDYSLYIVSNCQAGYIEVFLKTSGLSSYFEGHLCPGDTGNSKADNICQVVRDYHLQSPVYVGDTEGDWRAATKAGIPFVFASYGFGHVDNPWKQVDSFRELLDIFG